VSHDRYFINRTATRILALEGGDFTGYPGNYDYYLEKRDVIGNTEEAEPVSAGENETHRRISNPSAKETGVSDNKLSWQEQKALEAEKRKKQNRLKKVEEEIEALESRRDEINDEMSDPAVATNVEKLTALSDEHSRLEAGLNELYEEWELLLDLQKL
ncbi:MAG: ABC transporter ATP-binding protein, partial [Lachnospiraceae bacterium]|nr:ABC transporter ATP-binding protein [Lachnospiraceae bacterium]